MTFETDAERDQCWSQVFATVAFRRLVADLRIRGQTEITLAEIDERIARARARWRTGDGEAGG